MSHLASHDALTGLINRREFERRAQHGAASARSTAVNHAVLYLDLDQFKVVNDTCGHAAGDELLRQISALLRPRLREGDTLARLGGDEFGVLLENCPLDARAAHRGRAAQGRRRFPLRLAGRDRSTIGVSIGAGAIVADSRADAGGVLSAADAACYMAKEKGRNRVQRLPADDSDESRCAHGEMEWVESHPQRARGATASACSRSPIATVQRTTPRRAYYELLLRLRDESGELVSPAAFHPGGRALRPDAGDRSLGHQHARSRPWQHAEPPAASRASASCAINLSGASLGDDDFLDFVREQFAAHGIAARSDLLRDHRDRGDRELSTGQPLHPRAASDWAAASRSTTSASACRRSAT